MMIFEVGTPNQKSNIVNRCSKFDKIFYLGNNMKPANKSPLGMSSLT